MKPIMLAITYFTAGALMGVGYYLACMQTHHYTWVGKLGVSDPTIGVERDPVARFCLAHRGKPLMVVADTHQIVGEGIEWTLESMDELFAALS